MSTRDASNTRRFGTVKRGYPDYKHKLAVTSPGVTGAPAEAEVLELPVEFTEQIRALAQHGDVESVAFQSVAVSVLTALARVRRWERQGAAAAISLAQREKLEHMVRVVEAAEDALRSTLSTRGAMMQELREGRGVEESDERSWWFALTETLQALEENIEWVSSLVAGQPKGSATRGLISIIVRLLRRHYHELLAEAEQWMT